MAQLYQPVLRALSSLLARSTAQIASIAPVAPASVRQDRLQVGWRRAVRAPGVQQLRTSMPGDVRAGRQRVRDAQRCSESVLDLVVALLPRMAENGSVRRLGVENPEIFDSSLSRHTIRKLRSCPNCALELVLRAPFRPPLAFDRPIT
jgi:hypothetical protein